MFNETDIFVKGAKDADGVLQTLQIDALFCHWYSFSYCAGGSPGISRPPGTSTPISSRHSAVSVTFS